MGDRRHTLLLVQPLGISGETDFGALRFDDSREAKTYMDYPGIREVLTLLTCAVSK